MQQAGSVLKLGGSPARPGSRPLLSARSFPALYGAAHRWSRTAVPAGGGAAVSGAAPCARHVAMGCLAIGQIWRCDVWSVLYVLGVCLPLTAPARRVRSLALLVGRSRLDRSPEEVPGGGGDHGAGGVQRRRQEPDRHAAVSVPAAAGPAGGSVQGADNGEK